LARVSHRRGFPFCCWVYRKKNAERKKGTILMDGQVIVKLVRFIAGFILECGMLGMVFVGVEVSPFILALPFGLMGWDAPDLARILVKK
jgi:hypothetical protein